MLQTSHVGTFLNQTNSFKIFISYSTNCFTRKALTFTKGVDSGILIQITMYLTEFVIWYSESFNSGAIS
jgi:hypothetical protein